jgi:5,10-methylenetetrahydromethanopterin reductase
MRVSCSFPPSIHTPEYAAIAEDLGYERVWLYDSPALYHDIWVTLARIADRTEHVGIGTAVLVPNNRHPLVTASAIATIEDLAPGRLAVAIGTGFTGRMAMGKPALSWKFVRDYIATLRALLRGEVTEVDGAMVQMIHPRGFAPPRPIDVPIVIAANGPKGFAVAKELGDGVMTIMGGNPDFNWCATLVFGTVLDDGEVPTDERVISAAGAALTVVYHGMYEGNPEAVDGLPGGAEWRARLESIPIETRHLATHEDHLVRVTERDAAVIDGNLLPAFTWTGTPAEIAARVAGARASGVTELIYQPIGETTDQIARELRTFRAAATS